MNKRLISLGLCAVLSLFAPSLAHSAEIKPKLQAVLDRADRQEAIPVIVTFSSKADLLRLPQDKKARREKVVTALRETADREQRAARALLQARGKRFDPLWIVNGLAVQAPPDLIAALAAQPNVERIDYDDVVQIPDVQPAADAAAEWNINAVNAPELWARGYTGQGVTIAIVDSGVDVNHPDLAGSYHGGPAAWYDPYRQTTSPYDPDGHGTLVAGVAVGGRAGGSAIGVAPGARWIAAKIFRDGGGAENSQILKAFQWLLDPDGNPATADAVADVVNNSWGFEDAPGVCDSFFRSAIQNLKAAGIAVVFAAGNTGPAAGVSPANYPESFAVGATNPFSLLASFSAHGPAACDGSVFPALVAPGMAVRSSAIPALSATGYASVNGTSFSAPHVAGVMALLLSAAPTLPPAELERVLKASAADLGVPSADNEYGYGLVNARDALPMISGTPDIWIDDTVPPTDDLTIDFGHVPPGRNASQTVTVRNAGLGYLQIGGIDSPASPFALGANRCAGQVLGGGQSCTIEVRFTPGARQTYESSLAVHSSDPDQARLDLRLAGVGNTLPEASQLVFPADGATGVAVPVTFEWTQVPDGDGDPIRHSIVVAEREDFSDAAEWPVTAGHAGGPTLLAGAGGVLLAIAALRKKRPPRRIGLLSALILLAACGGGGGSDDAPVRPQGVAVNETVDTLTANTRYYWKIVSQDGSGARVESATFSFTTRP